MQSSLGTVLTFASWLEGEETNTPIEIVDGVPIVTPTPTGLHQLVVVRLATLFNNAAPEGVQALTSPWDWVISRNPLHNQAARRRRRNG